MPVTLNASTSSGFIATSDTSGSLELQANGTTKATVGSTGLSIGQYNPAASLITSGTAVNSTSGTSIDFTSIPSWVKRVTINFSGISTNGSSPIIVRIGAGSFVTSGYGGSYGYISGSTVSQSTLNSAFGLINAVTNVYSHSGIATLSLLGSNTWCFSSNVSIDATATAMFLGSGGLSVGGTLDRVRITTVNGTDTFDAGTINILYE